MTDEKDPKPEKKKSKDYKRFSMRIKEQERDTLEKRSQKLYIAGGDLLKRAGIKSNEHTLKRLLSTKEAMPDELHLKLDAKHAPGELWHRKVVLFHYPKFDGRISRFEFYLKGRRLQLIFDRSQIYEFVDDVDPVIAECLLDCNKILVVLMDEHMTLPQDEMYFAPLIIYKTPSLLYSVPDYMMRIASDTWQEF